MNGASEATLQELLAINQQMAASLSRLAGGAGGAGGGGGGGAAGGSAGIAAKSLNAVGAAAGATAGILGKVLGGAATGLGAVFDSLKQTGSALLNNQKILAEGFIDGNNKLSSLSAGLENLPFGLGLVAKAMTYQSRILEVNIDTFQKMSDSGARLGGNLDEVRRSAAATYLSMDEFANMLKANGPQLLNFGTTADDGARALIKFNSTMIKGDTGRALMGMGYTAEQANNMLGMMSETMGGVTAAQLKDQRGMEQSVKAFATELTLAAELEGKSREQMEKEMKERAQNAVRENMLSQMSADEKKAFLEAENRANAIGGKGARDALLAATLGLPPMTKEAQIFTATNQKASQAVGKMSDTLKDGTLSEAERQNKLDKLYGEGAKAAAEQAKEYGIAGKAIAMGTGPMAAQMQANLKLETQARNQNLKTEEDYVNRLKKTRAEVEASQKSEAGAAAQQAAAAKHAGGLMDQLSKLLAPLFPIIKFLTEGFATLATKVVGFAQDVINNVIKPVFQNLFGDLTLEEFVKPFKDFWDGLFGGAGEIDYKAITAGIVDFFKPMVTMFRDVMSSFDFKALGKSLGESLGNLFNTAKEILTPVIQRAGEIFGTIAADFGPVMTDLFDIVNSLIDIIRTVVWPVVKPVVDGFLDAMVPLWNAFKNIISAIKFILKGDFSKAGDMISGAIGNLIDAIKNFFGGILSGIKELASMGWDKVKSWLGFGGPEKKPETKAPTAQVGPAVSASPTAPPPPSTPMTAEAEKRAKELGTPPVKTEAGQQASIPSAVPPKSQNPQDILIAELQTLNKITTEMLRSLKDTADYTKSTANLIASNGNMFRRG